MERSSARSRDQVRYFAPCLSATAAEGKRYFGGFLLTDLRRPITLLTFVMTAFSLR